MKELKFTPEYEVTEDGKVFSIIHNWRGYGKRQMKYSFDKDGYPVVRLTLKGVRKKIRVHHLVAAKYLPTKPANAQIRHLDGDKLNNNAANLKWGTAKENAEDRNRHGRTSKGLKHSIAIRSSNQAEMIRLYHQSKRNYQ